MSTDNLIEATESHINDPTESKSNNNAINETENVSSEELKEKEIQNEPELPPEVIGLSGLECLNLGKSLAAEKKFDKAAEVLSISTERLVNEYGPNALLTGEAYYHYGRALVNNYISHSSVLAKIEEIQEDEKDPADLETRAKNALDALTGGDGVESDEEGEGEGGENENEKDLAVAWEVLELARLIYQQEVNNFLTPETNYKNILPKNLEIAKLLYEIFMTLGDMEMEKEQFKDAMSDFNEALQLKKHIAPCYDLAIGIINSNLAMCILMDDSNNNVTQALYHYRQAADLYNRRIIYLTHKIQQHLIQNIDFEKEDLFTPYNIHNNNDNNNNNNDDSTPAINNDSSSFSLLRPAAANSLKLLKETQEFKERIDECNDLIIELQERVQELQSKIPGNENTSDTLVPNNQIKSQVKDSVREITQASNTQIGFNSHSTLYSNQNHLNNDNNNNNDDQSKSKDSTPGLSGFWSSALDSKGPSGLFSNNSNSVKTNNNNSSIPVAIANPVVKRKISSTQVKIEKPVDTNDSKANNKQTTDSESPQSITNFPTCKRTKMSL